MHGKNPRLGDWWKGLDNTQRYLIMIGFGGILAGLLGGATGNTGLGMAAGLLGGGALAMGAMGDKMPGYRQAKGLLDPLMSGYADMGNQKEPSPQQPGVGYWEPDGVEPTPSLRPSTHDAARAASRPVSLPEGV